MDNRTFYTVYKITNKVNGKIYIGAHQTSNLNDGYMGSGIALKRAIRKYGMQNFEKEYLLVCSSLEEMYSIEKVLVNESFLKRKDVYNIKEGGFGGFLVTFKQRSKAALNKWHNSSVMKNVPLKISADNKKNKWGNPQWVARNLAKISETISFLNKKRWESPEYRKKQVEGMLKYWQDNDNRNWHSESKRGSKNNQYGKCWIFSKERRESKCVKKEELLQYLDNGWEKGRVIKFNRGKCFKEECNKVVKCLGLCASHYQAYYRQKKRNN